MVRAIALVLTLLTGFSGLVYEVTWQKYFATLLGSHSEATAAVLGIFLGGLSVGYAVFGGITRRLVDHAAATQRPPRLLRVYGFVEGSIGLYALAFPLLFRAVMALSGALSIGGGAAGFALDVALTALLIGPPTVLMGGTIPVLTQALSRSLEDATRFHALVYAFNTIGAFAGALAAGFVLVPVLGLDGAVMGMGAINLFAGGTFLWLGSRTRSGMEPGAPLAPASKQPVRGFAFFASAALLAGFAMMAIQTVLIRIGVVSFGASQFTFSMIVAVFVFCIALGSFVVSALPRIPTGSVIAVQWLLVLLLAAMDSSLQDAPYWTHSLRVLFRSTPSAYYPHFLTAFVAILGVLAIPVGLSGALLPLLFHELRREVGDLGAVAGRLYSWNTVGSLLGALIGGYLLLFWLDLHHVHRLAVIALGAGASLLAMRLLGRTGAVASGVALLLLAGALHRAEPWSPKRLSAGLFRQRTPFVESGSFRGPEFLFSKLRNDSRPIFYDDDPVSSVTVIESLDHRAFDRALITNGKPDSSIPDELPTVIGLGVFPCLLADRCESAFVIGLGTGVTAGELGTLDDVQRVVVTEISPGVRDAVPLFASGNHEVEKNPKVEIRHGDAYRSLLRDDGTYDVIVSEPSNPWVAGVENLYSEEFLRAAKGRLRPGGVYAQWFHLYESSDENVQLVSRTFSSVFESVAVWRGLGVDLILMGWNGSGEGALDVARLERRAALPGFSAALRRAGLDSVPVLLAHEVLPLGVLARMVTPGPRQSLFRPILANRAALDFFIGESADLVPSGRADAADVGARNSLLRRFMRLHGDRLTDAEWVKLLDGMQRIRPAGVTPLLAWWKTQAPDSPVQAEAARRLIGAGIVPARAFDALVFLFSDDAGTGPVPYERVAELGEQILQYYLPGVPFHRRTLFSALARCDDGGTRRCDALARALDPVLGRLDREVEIGAQGAETERPVAPAARSAGS